MHSPRPSPPRARTLGAALLLACAPWAALADGHGSLAPAKPLAEYTTECGSCHIAFAPALLPAASWARIMSGLSRHYGSDASLDPAAVTRITGWLAANAGTARRAGEEPPQDRISQSRWFLREHRKVGSDVWARPSIRSAANCTACHAQASEGDFNEHHVRIPR